MNKRLYLILSVLLALSISLSACEEPTPAETPVPPETPTPRAAPIQKTPAVIEEIYEFRLQNHDTPDSVTAGFLDAWSQAVKEASGGRISIRNFHDGILGSPRDSYNMVLNGEADIAWGLPSYSPGMFPLTDAISLPFIGATSSLQASYALWELYDSTDYLKDEWSDVQMLLLHTGCDSPLISNTRIDSVEGFRDMNLRINGGPTTEWAKLVGANPMGVPITEVYDRMESGDLDGVTSTGWDVIDAYKLYEQGSYYLDYAIQVCPYFLIMNKDSYEGLPDDLKAVIDEFSGYGALEIVGDRWEVVKEEVISAIGEAGGEIYGLSDTERAKLDAYGVQARRSWIMDITASGTNAEGMVSTTIELLRKHRDK